MWDGSGEMGKCAVAGHRWRRARARASLKVGLGLGYQAAVRQGMGSDCCSWWAAKVTQEKRASRIGVVWATARWDHWRWVSTPRWARTSLGFAPRWLAEQRCEWHENGYNGSGQGEHDGTFREKSGL